MDDFLSCKENTMLEKMVIVEEIERRRRGKKKNRRKMEPGT
jgi:hypothetical protein